MGTPQYKAHDPTPEERAFVYQQIQEINEFAPGLDGIVMMLEEAKTKKAPHRFAATLVLGPKNLGLQIRAEADDFFSALSAIKYEAKESLAQIIAGSGGLGDPEKTVRPGAKGALH